MADEFDIKSLFVSVEDTKEIVLKFEGKDIPITVRDLTWAEKNQVLGGCFVYKTDGSMGFDIDRYMKSMLTKMIVKAPWGKTDMIFLTQIKANFGNLLQSLVPKAFEEATGQSFFVTE